MSFFLKKVAFSLVVATAYRWRAFCGLPIGAKRPRSAEIVTKEWVTEQRESYSAGVKQVFFEVGGILEWKIF